MTVMKDGSCSGSTDFTLNTLKGKFCPNEVSVRNSQMTSQAEQGRGGTGQARQSCPVMDFE